MIIGVLHEPSPETRVSLLPEHVDALCKAGHKVVVQNEAGLKAFAFDDAYKKAGARMGEKKHEITNDTLSVYTNSCCR